MAEEKTEEIFKNEEQQNRKKERLIKILEDVTQKMQKVVNETPEAPPEEKILSVDKMSLNILSKRFQSGKFSFWGGLVNSSAFPDLHHLECDVPTIKNIIIPEKSRKQDYGSKIVKVWEESFREKGFFAFAITNVKYHDETVMKFWQKQGYVIPESEKRKSQPYYMMKVIKS